MREDEPPVDEGQWRTLTADLSQREFAKERGVPLSNLRHWLNKLRKESSGTSS